MEFCFYQASSLRPEQGPSIFDQDPSSIAVGQLQGIDCRQVRMDEALPAIGSERVIGAEQKVLRSEHVVGATHGARNPRKGGVAIKHSVVINRLFGDTALSR